jgi:hypothetical protein
MNVVQPALAGVVAIGPDEHVVIGFRANGAGSLFFGGEPAYHFNFANELRRAYRAGELIKAERGQLVALVRRREAAEVQLVRRELDAKETAAFMQELSQHLSRVIAALNEGRFSLVGEVPLGADVVGRARRWLDRLAGNIVIAQSARVS